MRIRLYEHPLAPRAPQIFEVESLAEWLLDRYEGQPQVGVQIYAGEPSAETELTTAEAILAADGDEYVVLQTPGIEVKVIGMILASIMVNAVMSMLMAPRQPPPNVNRSQQSPNNALANRENRVRLQERVEDIFGRVKSVPSLMMPTYHKYIENNRVEYGYYCVGRGYYQISEIRDGESLISAISGASAAVYEPFTSPNSGHGPAIQIGDPIIDTILTVARSVEVDGITLLHENQIVLPNDAEYTFTPDPNGDYITQTSKKPNLNAVAEVGQMVQIYLPDEGPRTRTATGSVESYPPVSRISHSGTPGIFAGLLPGAKINIGGAAANGGVYTVLEAESVNSIRTVEALNAEIVPSGVTVVVAMDFPTTWTGVREIAAVWDGGITLVGSLWGGGPFTLPAALTVDNDLADWSDWVTLAAPDRREVWANIVAPQGMYKDDGGKSATSVSFEMQIGRLDSETLAPTGHVETSTGTVSGSTTAERGQTVEHVTSWTGPARVRVRRTTPFDYDFEGVVVDEVKFSDLYAVSPIGPQHFGNKTTIHTVTRSTPRATSFRQRQLNCIATRRLPIFDGTTFSGAFDAEGRHVSGTITPTDRMVDILAAVCVDPKIGGRTLDEVDLAQIWGVQQALDAWNPECSRFSYTFDSDELSFEETVQVIANACFCTAYRQNGKIRFALDRPQSAAAALFTHRNKRPARDKAETISRTFPTAAEYDGVEFVYIDEDSHTAESFTLPQTGALKAKKFEIPGIRSFTQAWLRAQREYAKLIGQRVTIETDVTTDARLLLPHTRVNIVDNTRFKSYDGEVVGQSGLQLTLSQPVQFTPGQPHSILLMRRDGTLQSIACTPGADDHSVILAAPPSEPVVTEFGAEGVRTIFSFAADSARGAQSYLVQEIGVSDGRFIRIVGVNYSDSYYAGDAGPIPAKASILS